MKWMKSNKHCTFWILQILCYYFTIYSRHLKISSLLQWSIPSFVGPQSCKKGIKLGLVAWSKVIFNYDIFYQVFDAGILFMHVIWWYEIWRAHLGALTKQGGWVGCEGDNMVEVLPPSLWDVRVWLKFTPSNHASPLMWDACWTGFECIPRCGCVSRVGPAVD